MEARNIFTKVILIIIAAGIWVIVLQNTGIIPTSQRVFVTNRVDTYVRDGYVNVGNDVDVNLQYINGQSNVFFNNPSRGDKDRYYRIPVTIE